MNETYRVGRRLGEGGMGEVYEATHVRLPDKRVAIKVLTDARAPTAMVRFRREAEIATRLAHPHIVEVHDFHAMPDGTPYLVMELLDGEDLAARIARVGGLPMASVRRIVHEMAAALDAAHAIGVIHRDLKPHNVFLCRRGDRDDHVKLLDFGVSKVLDAVAVTTERSSVLGTVQYMAPEVARGFIDAIDARTDVFGFGAIVWEMLTGRQAFTGPSLTAILHAVLSVDPPPVHTLRRELSPQVSEVVARALAKDRDARWPSCGELARAIDAALVPSGPVEPAVMPPSPPPRRQIWPWIAGAGGVLAIAVVGALAVSKKSPPAVKPDQDVSCAEVTSHLVEVIHRERPSSWKDDDVAEDVRRHCETDRWDAEARRCAMAATNLTVAESCVKK